MKIRILSKVDRQQILTELSTVPHIDKMRLRKDFEDKSRECNLVRIGDQLFWTEKELDTEEKIRAAYLRCKVEGLIKW